MKVIKRFNDIKTRKRYEVGDSYDGPRKSELQAKGYLEPTRKHTETKVSDESRSTGSKDNAEAKD